MANRLQFPPGLISPSNGVPTTFITQNDRRLSEQTVRQVQSLRIAGTPQQAHQIHPLSITSSNASSRQNLIITSPSNQVVKQQTITTAPAIALSKTKSLQVQSNGIVHTTVPVAPAKTLQVAKTVQVVQQQVPTATTTVIQSSPVVQKIAVVQQHHNAHQIAVSQAISASNDELLVKELEAYKKKCHHLEEHILIYSQKLEILTVTEQSLTDTLSENRALTQQNGELIGQITLLRQELEFFSRLALIEVEYQKIQELYQQQVLYIEQLNQELLIKNTTIKELNAKDEQNQKIIEDLNRLLKQQRDNQDEQVKRSKKQQQDQDKQAQDKVNDLLDQLQEKDKEISNLLLLLSHAEQEKIAFESRIQTLVAQLQVLEGDLGNSQNILNAKNQEIERLRDNCNQYLLQIHTLSNLEIDKARLEQQLQSRNAEIDQWRNQVSILNVTINELREQNAKIFQLENKIVQLTLEIERLRTMHDYKDDEVKRSRNRQGELEKEADDKRILQGELAQLQERLTQLSTQLSLQQNELNNKQKEIEEQRLKLNQMFTLQLTIQQNETLINALTQKISALEADIKSARETSFNQEVENNNLKKQLQEANFKVMNIQSEVQSLKNLTKDYQQVRQSASEHEFKVINLTQNIQNLNSLIQQRESQIAQWKQQWETVSSENEQYKLKINELNFQIHSLSITIHESAKQSDILSAQQALNADLTSQNEILRNRLLQLELKLEEAVKKASEDKLQLENKLALLTMELQRKDLILQNKDKDIETIRSQLSQYVQMQIQFSQLQYEVNALKQENQNQQFDIESWRNKYHQVEHFELEFTNLLGKYVLTVAEVESLRSQQPPRYS